MQDRLTTLVGALLSLAVFYGLFFAGKEQVAPITRPTTIEEGDNGYFALHQWLLAESVNTYSLRGRFPSLVGNPDIRDATRNVLITTLPHFTPMRETESEALSGWIASGNTLLVLAALNDTPDWSFVATTPFLEDLQTLSGLWFYSQDDEPAAPAQRSDDGEDFSAVPVSIFENTGVAQEYEIVPRAAHPLMRGVSAMKAESDYESSVWLAVADELLLEVATMQQTDTPVIWQRKSGNGQVIIVGSGSLLTNRAIARADNRRFVANLVRQNLGRGATVIFDDQHQGLSNIYDPDAFFSDSRLHYTIYFIIALWLLYIVGSSNRLVDPPLAAKPLRQTDFVEATAGFINRRMSTSAVGLWMFRAWFNDLRNQMRLKPNGEPVWQELDALTTLDKRLLRKLDKQYHRLLNKKKVNLIELHNTIREARRAIG